jgi:hypothetical protein
MSDNLVIKPKMPSFKKGIAANRENAEKQIKEIDPSTVTNRLGLIFDDSGSMSGESISNAHSAVKNFTLSCNFTDTSIAIYPLNKNPKPLTCDYDLINLFVMGIGADGSTPIYTKLLEMIEKESITRAVIFSDGGPTDSKLFGNSEYWDSKPKDFAVSVLDKYIQKELPIDTIFIGITESSGYKEMQEIARLTGGIFIHFKDSTSLSSNLKYLTPRYRALLANAELKDRIQKGETI